MNPEQQQAILTIALLAAFADGANDEREREQIRRLAESLGGESATSNLPGIYQQVLLKRASVKDAAVVLSNPDHRKLAYEMAVCVCDADGHTSVPEQDFLLQLSIALNLDSTVTTPANAMAESMAQLADDAAPLTPTATTVNSPAAPTMTVSHSVSNAKIDRSILNYSIINGALELLPQSWASMAIIPLQIKMVYGIGKEYGYELDQGHIREFLSTLGVGLTSQYLEQFGRKLLGGLFGKAMGSMGKHAAQSATGIAFSFATTYALGQVARRYYAGGRQMSTGILQDCFQGMLGPAKEMQAKYLPQIQQKAGGLDAAQVISMVRGS